MYRAKSRQIKIKKKQQQQQLEVRNSQVMKSSYETELRKMTSQFESQTRKFLQKVFFRVTNLTS